MSKTIRCSNVAKAMFKDGKHKTMVPKWYAITATQSIEALTKIVEADRIAMTDAAFRSAYAQYLTKVQR